MVAEHPFYTVTDEDGRFTLENVPPGQYTLRVWQESLGTVEKEITVGDGGVNGVTLEMSSQ